MVKTYIHVNQHVIRAQQNMVTTIPDLLLKKASKTHIVLEVKIW